MAAYHFLVQGRVQGVGYRYFVQREADVLGVTGFVRNLPDGNVEVVAEGGEQAMAQLEARLREGPSFGMVSSVARSAIAARGDAGFHIR